MKKFYFLILCILVSGFGHSQCDISITFTTQSEIDSFSSNYPGCSSVLGTITIYGDGIINLNGLSALTSVGSLNISNVSNLTNYSGLNNLTTITGNFAMSGTSSPTINALSGLVTVGGSFNLDNMVNLVSFIGLNNLSSVGSSFSVSSNTALTALPGTTSLSSVGGNLLINYNPALVSVSGLNNLTSVNGYFSVYDNDVLSSLTPFSDVTSINGYLSIQYNETLASLSGLQNIDPTTIDYFYLYGSSQLSACSLPNVCTYLSNGGSFSIGGNAEGCQNTTQLAVACGTPQNCTDVYLYSQADVDNYQFNNGCSVISGTLYLTGNMTNLDGLSQITSVGNLTMSNVPNLTDFSGLDNLTTVTGNLSISSGTATTIAGLSSITAIGGSVDINSTGLTQLPDFEDLTTIGGYLNIHNNVSLLNLTGIESLTSVNGFLSIYNNGVLQNVNALSNVTTINGYLSFQYNYALESISGVGNINPATIDYLYILFSSVLSVCNVPSVCEYLATGGSNNIYANATGCGDFAQTIGSCNPVCPIGDVYLYSQEDVDNFVINYPSCTSLNGSLYIGGSDITSLTPLNAITSILGSLTISSNTSLTSLNGLHNLESIYGGLNISYNSALTSLSGLGDLTHITGNINVNYNNALATLAGLGSISTVQNVIVTGNPQLTSLTGLSDLQTTGEVNINTNIVLQNLNGLQNLQSVNSLYINGNAMLTSLAALSNLQTVSSSITISTNHALTSLSGLQSLTEIPNLTVSSNNSLASLSGLSSFQTSAYINIESNPVLVNLDGLDDLVNVYQIYIQNNDALVNMSGLGSLTSSTYLHIIGNDSLVDLSGLNALTSVLYSFYISGNPALENFEGLENVTTVGTLNINDNDTLLAFTGLEGLITLNYLYVTDNLILPTLGALSNVNPATFYGLTLNSSVALSTCDVPAICSFLSNGGSATISGNATGCNSSIEIQIACNTATECPSGALIFTNQSEIDAFIVNYPTCTTLGSVSISGNNITNLNGLSNITNISTLNITNSSSLTNLSGLNSLTTVSSLVINGNTALTTISALSALATANSVSVYNNSVLVSVAGLENIHDLSELTINSNPMLTSLATFANLGAVYSMSVADNASLTNFNGLQTLTSVYQLQVYSNPLLTSIQALEGLTSAPILYVYSNAVLPSLAGLQNIVPTQLSYLYIVNSPNLVTCDLVNLCTFLTNGGSSYIFNNGSSCNTSSDIQIACGDDDLPTYGSVSPGTLLACANTYSVVTISGLIPNSVSSVGYNINGGATIYATISSDLNGNGDLGLYPEESADGMILTIVSVERTDVATGVIPVTSNNTVMLDINTIMYYFADNDGDGYGNPGIYAYTCTPDAGYVANSTDCDDSDVNAYQTTLLYIDNDADGYTTGQSNVCYGGAIPTGYSATSLGSDCNDNDAAIHNQFAFYIDSDGDGYGAGSSTNVCAVNATTPPSGYSINNTDCSPSVASVYQSQLLYVDIDGDGYDNGSSTVCYGATIPAGYLATTSGQDCDDNDNTKQSGYLFYADIDGDGFGVGGSSSLCWGDPVTPPPGYSINNTDCAPNDATKWQDDFFYTDFDLDGYDNGSGLVCYGASIPVGYSLTTNGPDCNDSNAAQHAGFLFYTDADGDGYGTGSLVTACALNAETAPTGYSLNNTDCDATDASIFQSSILYTDADLDGYDAGSSYVCYGASIPTGYSTSTSGTDCDDDDNTVQIGYQFYVDNDGDGFGTGSLTLICAENATTPPTGYSLNNTDCDDTTPLINAMTEYFVDADYDGYGSTTTAMVCSATVIPGYSLNNLDCNDANAAVFPGAVEICDGIDNDCNDLIDGDDPGASGQQTVYADADGDGFGNPLVSQTTCSAIPNYVSNGDDCNDSDPLEQPGQLWYIDKDEDGYGTTATVSQCIRPLHGFLPAEMTQTYGDCNDNDATLNPGAQYFTFSGAPNFTSAIISPLIGSLYDTFNFEVTYYDANNAMPPATFPRVYLDYNANGVFTEANDRGIIMTPFDASDTNTADGKRYIASVDALAYGTNWQARVQIQNGSCITEFGPFDYPDVLVQPDLQIFANDITFSTNHPAVSAPFTVNAVIHNISDFPASNFYAHLVNQYDPSIVYGDILISSLAQQSTTTVTWNITTPNVPAWCPMQVIIDYTDTVSESNELNNSAVRPFINGNYNLIGGIEVLDEQASPQVSYIIPGYTTYVTVSGRGEYYGTPTPLLDPSVAGATVTYTVAETGASYSTYTNSLGEFSLAFPTPNTPGQYHITGEMTDFTFIGDFNLTFERILYVEPCPTEMYGGITLVTNTALTGPYIPQNTIVEGESVSGSFTVSNGCTAVDIETLLDISQTGGLPAIGDVMVPPMASGATFTTNFSNVVFDTPGYYTICGAADGSFLVNEINEDNTWCVGINVLPNMPDIHPYYGPSGSAYLCAENTINFTLRNSGGAASGEFTCDIIVRHDGIEVDVLHETVTNIQPLDYYSFSKPYNYAATGNYTFELKCDVPLPGGVVAETDELNNEATYTVTIFECQADLYLAGCESFDVQPVDPQFPGSVTYLATIINGGNAIANGPIDVRFELSGGQVYTTQYADNLAPGQSASVTVNAAAVASATQTLTAIVDPNNNITEANDANNDITNELCWDFQASLGCGLHNVYDTTYLVNQSIYPVLGIVQPYLYDASSVNVRFQVSGPGLSGTVDLGNATVTNLEQTCSCPVVAALPYSFVFPTEGIYTFTMTVDPDNSYIECNEGNNVIVRNVNVSNLPDMRVLSQFINPSLLNPEPGEAITMNITYENIGTTNIEDTMQLSVLVNEVPLASVSVIGLGTGENNTVAIPVPYSSTLVGAHIIRAIIDSGNDVVEGDEINNEATRAIVVGEAANLNFNLFAASTPTPLQGSNIAINATIGNNGDLASEGDVMFYYTNNQLELVEIGMIHVNVPGNGSVVIQMPWTVVDPSTTIVAKIVNSSVLEFTYDDNEATTTIGGMSLDFALTSACGTTNGSATALPSGGQQPYSYVWLNGFNGATLSAPAGTYHVVVTDNTGQTVEGSATISEGTGNETFYADVDGDGFGNPNSYIVACSVPNGYVTDNTDCDDTNDEVNGIFEFFADMDGDGYGTGETVSVCAANETKPPAGYSVNNTDCNDAVAAINPGAPEVLYNGIDDNCDNDFDGSQKITTKVQTSQCGANLLALYTSVGITAVANATAYRVRVTNTATNVVQVIERNTNYFNMTQFPNYDYSTTYSVEIEVKRGSFWLGYYGPACLISTPGIVSGNTQVSPVQCGNTLPQIYSSISVNQISGVTGYKFRITNLTDPSAPNQVQTIERNANWFKLDMLTTYTYGTTYRIEVAVKTTGAYGEFGSPCSISTPAVPTLTNCSAQGTVVPSASTTILAPNMPRTTFYKFELTNSSTNQVITIVRPFHFSFNNVTGYIPGATYNVRVAVMSSGTYSLFGNPCVVIAPGGTTARIVNTQDNVTNFDFEAVAYPNPFADYFAVQVTTASSEEITLQVHDMAGRLLEVRKATPTNVSSLQLGDRYPAGVYNVIVNQGEEVKTLRVIKR